jgi:outer membrane protein
MQLLRILWALIVFLVLLSPSISPSLSLAAPVTLGQAFSSALEKSETVRQSGEQLTQAEERVKRIRGGLFPEISFNANHTLQHEPDNALARQFSPKEQTTANFTLLQPIFRGLREFAGLRQQKALVTAQEASRKQATQTLYSEVATAHLQILSHEQDLRNLEEQLEIYGRRTKAIQGRARRGESSTTELLSSQSTYSSLQAEARLVQGQLRVARENFRSLTGLPHDSQLADPGLVPKEPNKRALLAKLPDYLSRIEERPDVQAARAQSEAGGEGVAVARGAHLPTIDALANYYVKRPSFYDDIKWDVQLRLSFPLFAGGATQAQVNEASARDRELELTLARARRLAADEIRAIHETLEARLDQLSFLQKSAELAERNVNTSEREFSRGLVRSIDVQQALAEYRVLRRSLDQARFAAQLERIRLDIAAGYHPEGSTK